jgi:hypothetical protein
LETDHDKYSEVTGLMYGTLVLRFSSGGQSSKRQNVRRIYLSVEIDNATPASLEQRFSGVAFGLILAERYHLFLLLHRAKSTI